MWRRIVVSHLKTTLISSKSSSSAIVKPSTTAFRSSSSSSFFFSRRRFSTDAEKVFGAEVSKKVEDVIPIATGHEREELQAELQGKDILEINYPAGPFGTKENPAIVKSYYDKRIVGCPGGEGEDEHDVVWFWLEKDKPYECPVCTQYFKLEVVGPGGDPEGHDDDHHAEEHHH